MQFRSALKRALFLSSVPAILAFAVACGGGDDDDAHDGVANGVTGVPDGAPLIDQDNLKFSPTSLTVKSGEVVYFHNDESALHTVTINGKNESGNMKRDATFQWTAPAAGEYQVTCDFHPQMKATVTVQ